ncbi:hypothetical protein [Altererythrobacter sp. ZODW24]|uniref:hypothetical protein n=1 Tax=Altererythrobacter sp. ZODW24 TaxID=2185142 RepID=UPI000DF7A8F8|nr:hypothetical protein [Altererythrobacter sp. ZODW24]
MSEYMLIAAASLVGLVVVAASMLKGWEGWLALKRSEIERATALPHAEPEIEGGAGSGMARIEIADLKERIRKLEAIASGVEL